MPDPEEVLAAMDGNGWRILSAAPRAVPPPHEKPRKAVNLKIGQMLGAVFSNSLAQYAKLAQRFITWMTSHTSAGQLFDVDIALRPDGASGMLVSSVQAFERYQDNSAWIWEHQALTRARFCAGDAAIGQRFEQIRCQVLRRVRPLDGELKREVQAMRKKMADARPNRSELFDLKQDAGGMIDIEFIVQYLVLQHAATYSQLTGNVGNIALLKMCGELGLVNP
eukprot:gene24096-27263_t